MVQLQNYMTVLITGILSSLAGCACGNGEIDDTTEYTYQYKNHTSHPLSIFAWQQGNPSVYSIQPNETLNYTIALGFGADCSVNGNPSENPHCLLIHSDSIKIIFDSSRFLRFDTNTPSPLNILKFENYSYEKVAKMHIYRYNFSDIDYNSAEDCYENCE
ncbi:MAG: hypothetical protein ACON42_03500 [Flavobacteriaceae bacterium]